MMGLLHAIFGNATTSLGQGMLTGNLQNSMGSISNAGSQQAAVMRDYMEKPHEKQNSF